MNVCGKTFYDDLSENSSDPAKTELPRDGEFSQQGVCDSGVPCFADTFVQGGSSVLRIKFGTKTPRHRKPQKRQTVAKPTLILV